MPFCHLATSNLDLHYTLHGIGPNKVLFVMGLITDGGAWGMQTDYFTLHHPEYQCVTYDHRGIGKSSLGNAWRHTTSMMANDACGLVNHLGWDRFHVVGVSMGGMISIELACTHPQRILSLSLISTHAGGFPYATIAPWGGVIQLFRSLTAPTEQLRVERALALLYGKKTLMNESKRQLLTEHHIKRLRNREKPKIAGIIAQLLAIPSHYVSYSRLLRIRYCPFPTLVLVGTEDALIREQNSRIIARTICATKFVVVDGAGHAPLAEDAEIVNQELLENFKRGDELKHLNTADQAKYQQHLLALDLCCQHRASCFLHIAANTIKGFAAGAVVGTICRFLINNDYLHNDRTTWSPMWRLAFIVAVARCGYTSFTCLRRSIIAYLAFKKLAKTHSHSAVRDNVLEEREHISSEHYWFPISPIFYLLAASWMALKYRNQIVA